MKLQKTISMDADITTPLVTVIKNDTAASK